MLNHNPCWLKLHSLINTCLSAVGTTHCHRGKPRSEKVTHWPAASSINRYISIVCCAGSWWEWWVGGYLRVLICVRCWHCWCRAASPPDVRPWSRGPSRWRSLEKGMKNDTKRWDDWLKFQWCSAEGYQVLLWMDASRRHLVDQWCLRWNIQFFFIFKIKLLFLQHEHMLHCF